MNAFRVWERSVGNASGVRVESEQNAKSLLGRLSRLFVFKGSAPLREETGTACWTFQVPYTSQLSRLTFVKLLAGIPEVHLMREGA